MHADGVSLRSGWLIFAYSVEDLETLAGEEAINAATNVVRDTVNLALGWSIWGGNF